MKDSARVIIRSARSHDSSRTASFLVDGRVRNPALRACLFQGHAAVAAVFHNLFDLLANEHGWSRTVLSSLRFSVHGVLQCLLAHDMIDCYCARFRHRGVMSL